MKCKNCKHYERSKERCLIFQEITPHLYYGSASIVWYHCNGNYWKEDIANTEYPELEPTPIKGFWKNLHFVFYKWLRRLFTKGSRL